MTAFDPDTLHQLVDDVQERPFVLQLASTFRRMLAPRVERIMTAVMGRDPDEAMDAVLSLKVAATMTGAGELAGLTASIEADLRHVALPSARARALLLPAAAHRAAHAIDLYLADVADVDLADQRSIDSMR